MYVHIGNNEILNINDVVAVLDVNTLKTSRTNLRILNKLKERNRSDDESVIVVQKGDKTTEFFSNISVSTLRKRLEKNRASHFHKFE